MAKLAEINVNKLNKDYTLKVKVNLTKQFKVRKIIAFGLIKAAAGILGCGIEIE